MTNPTRKDPRRSNFPMELAAQAIGIVAMSLNIVSFQFKSRKKLITAQLFGGLLFTVHYLLLGLATGTVLIGCVLNFMSVFRSVIYINKDRLHADRLVWKLSFSVLFVIAYAMVFLVFKMSATPANLAIEVLPTVSMIISTFALAMNDSKGIRRLSLIYCPLWLVYNIIRFSIGGAICEIFSISSVVVGMLRHDIKKRQK